MPTSNLLNSKRALVKLLRELSAIHGFNLPLTRDSPDADVARARRRAHTMRLDPRGPLRRSESSTILSYSDFSGNVPGDAERTRCAWTLVA